MRAFPTRMRPFSASSGSSERASPRRPTGAYRSRSRSCSAEDLCSVTLVILVGARLWPKVAGGGGGSDAVGAELVLGVGQLAGVLHEEARLAHELVRALGLDAVRAVGAVLAV